MRQANAVLPVYTADNSAMCSTLYELGGLLVMHDASGCNSTYTTHDEPRWYNNPAMVYISGLNEMDAVLGNEKRLIGDIVRASEQLHPKFIALAGTPIPMMMGCDYDGIAREIQAATGVVSFGVDTNGTQDYVSGINKTLVKLADRFCLQPGTAAAHGPLRINILGVTPLDFSIGANSDDLVSLFTDEGMEVISTWAMGTQLEAIARAGCADVNVVVTAGGIDAAQLLRQRFGTPFVIGAPVGDFMTSTLINKIRDVAVTRQSCNLAVGCRDNPTYCAPTFVIGEPVMSAAIRACLVKDLHVNNVRVLTSLSSQPILLAEYDHKDLCEDDYLRLLPQAGTVIADPLYRHILTLAGQNSVDFIDFPHEAFSGRIWRDKIPRFMGHHFIDWWTSVRTS